MHEESMRTHEHWLCTHAQYMHMHGHKLRNSLTASSQYLSKLILDIFLPLLRHHVYIQTHPTIKPKHFKVQKHIKMEDHSKNRK